MSRSFPEFSEPRAITSGPHDHFFANYFGINAWSPDGRYALVLETDIKDVLPDGKPCTLGLVDLHDGNRFIPVTTTRCWNFQEAAMAHWLKWAPDTFVYNDLRDGKFCAVVKNWRTKAEKVIPYPVSAVSEDGTWAVSINYARLYLTRPDYGYAGEGQDPHANVVFPNDDGLFRVDLRTGEAKLIVSCADVAAQVPKVKSPGGLSYFCHTVISRDGKLIYFLSRSVEGSMEGVKKFKGVNWQTTAFTCKADGTEIRRCFPDGWGSSHFNWKPALSERDARTMIVTCNWRNRVYTHVEFTVGEEERARQVGGDGMNFDGHCIYSPDGKFISGDGYWDEHFDRHWKMVRLEDNAVREIGTFHVPEAYRDVYCRCDLHPRWRPDGRMIGFNSVHEGSRQVYVMDVREKEAGDRMEVRMLPQENWWGICNNFGGEMPFNAATDFKTDLRLDNYSHQSLSLLISDKGRAVWCPEPVGVVIAGGTISLESDKGAITLVEKAGRNLAEAYRYASKTWFPPTGEEPELLYFSAPQYNTWIELTYHQNEKDILAYARSMLDNGMPPGIFMIDDTWQRGYGDWEFESSRFKDPKGMMDKLHAMGFKVLLWMCPFVSSDSPAFRRLQYGLNPDDVKGWPTVGGLLACSKKLGRGDQPLPAQIEWWNGYSSLLDFSHPNAVAWFTEQLDRLQRDYGADGFKFDGGGVKYYVGSREHPVIAHDPTLSPSAQSALYGDFALKYKGSEYRNVFGFAGKPVIMRLLDKRHDWQDLNRLIPDMIAAGLVGCPFVCPDMVGGGQWVAFIPGAPFSQELFVRSAQVQALSPMMQFSASPWRCLDERNRQIIRDTVALRQKFAPKFTELAKQAAKDGEPIMRNLEYAYPGQGYAAIRDEFLMGEDLLVAPVLEKGAKTRKVVLPPGRWRSDDGTEYVGPATVEVETPLARLPYFERMSGKVAKKSGPAVIAERGRTPARTIVTAENPSPSLQYAAQELQSYVRQLTDVELPIATAAEGACVRLERTDEFGPDGFRLKVENGDVIVRGGVRGVLYGVYELLETYGGIGWFASWHTVVPHLDRFVLPGDLDDVQRPAFQMRMTSWKDACEPDFAARLRYNGQRNRLGEKHGGVMGRFGWGMGNCHTFDWLLRPKKKSFQEHPEYFALRGGKRVPGQPCLTNPDVLRIVTSNTLAAIASDPNADFYGVSQNDNHDYCECPSCAAVDKEEGSHSGSIVRFVNAVAEEVEKHYPRAVIETLAYTYGRKPPAKTRLRHNVVPCLCSIECDFSKPLDVSRNRQNIAFLEDMRGWARQTDGLYIWDYTTNFRNYLHAQPNFNALQGNLKVFRANGAKYIYAQGDSLGLHADFAELRTWLLAKWMWNPDQPAGPLLDRFFKGYYGAAAPFVRRYFDELHALPRDEAKHPLSCYSLVWDTILPTEFFERAEGIWKEAAEAVKDDPACARNVEAGALAVDFTLTQRLPHRRKVWVTRHPENFADDRQSRSRVYAQRLLESRKRLDLAFAEGFRNEMFLKDLQWLADGTAPTNGQDRVEVPASSLRLAHAGEYGHHLPCKEALDGTAFMLCGTHYEWCVRLDMKNVAYDPGVKYRIRVRARLVRNGEITGEAIRAGIYDLGAKTIRKQMSVKAEDCGDDWAWYDVATWTPNDRQYFWLSPGRFDKKNGKESAVKFLWIDRLEISRVP